MEEKIYGLYPADLNPEQIDGLEEYLIYFAINDLGGYIWSIRHRHSRGDDVLTADKLESLKNSQYQLEYLVNKTRKFGVEFSREPQKDQHVERSESYNKWFKFWNDHFSKMSNDDFSEFDAKLTKGEDVSNYLPKRKWNEDDSVDEKIQ